MTSMVIDPVTNEWVEATTTTTNTITDVAVTGDPGAGVEVGHVVIMFRCPHRPWQQKVGTVGGKSRSEVANARRNLYPVPGDADWTRVDDVYDPGKSVRRKVNGKIVNVKVYEHEQGHRYEALVTCPDCGDEILISTDQEP